MSPESSRPPDDARHEVPPASAVERLGGEERLRAIIDSFVDRVIKDMMIGFFFRSTNIERLKQFEYEFALGHLGGQARYTGRPLPVAHERHHIFGGHFNRRLKILENTLRDFQAPEDVIREWLEHNERLRPLIVRDTSGECVAPRYLPPEESGR